MVIFMKNIMMVPHFGQNQLIWGHSDWQTLTLLDTCGVLIQCLTVLFFDELKVCGAILHQMLFQLLIFNVLNVLFDSLSSVSQCLCMSLSKHDVCFQASMEEAVPSKEAEEAFDERRPASPSCCERAKISALDQIWVCWQNHAFFRDFPSIFRQTHLVAFYVCFLHCWRFNIWEEISTTERMHL